MAKSNHRTRLPSNSVYIVRKKITVYCKNVATQLLCGMFPVSEVTFKVTQGHAVNYSTRDFLLALHSNYVRILCRFSRHSQISV